jgi:streptogramin lyase
MRTRWAAAVSVTAIIVGIVAPITQVGATGSAPRTTSIWVGRAGLEEITRLRLDGKRQAEVDICCEPRAIAVGPDAVWAATDAGTVLRVDPSGNEVVAEVEVGGSPGSLAITRDAVWVAVDGTEIVRIDPATNEVVGRTAVGAEGAPIVDVEAGEGAIWVVTDFVFSLVRLDPVSGEVTARLPLCPATECRVGAVATSAGIADGTMWVVDATADELLDIDPTGPVVRRRVPLGPGSWTVAAGSEGLWLLDADRGRLERVDPTAPTSRRRVATFESPELLTLGAGAVWLYERGQADIIRVRPRDLEVVDRTSVKRVRTIAVG